MSAIPNREAYHSYSKTRGQRINSLKGKEPLSGYRALDLTDEKGWYCGKILGDLGVDVIKIEKPGGDPCRRIGPFYHDIPDPEKSIYWFVFNSNKRGITLDIATLDGKQLFKKLAKTMDFVVESFDPGYMQEIGLGYEVLKELNPRLIMTAITPFGQTGPYKDYVGSDIALMASGGYLHHVGDTDRPPVLVVPPQSYYNAGTEAAIGTLMAHIYRERTGQGQYIDVSIQASMCMLVRTARYFWELNHILKKRQGNRYSIISSLSIGPRLIFPCKDGYIAFALYGGAQGAPTNKALVEWMEGKGIAPQFLREKNWYQLNMATITQQELDKITDTFAVFFLTLTRAEFYEGALERRIMGYPVSTVEDVVTYRQLSARDFWQQVEHPELDDTIIYPGAFAKFSETPIGIRRRAPLIGEHNEEVYSGELGFSSEELCVLKQAGVI